jgi:acetyl esterase/lipase
MPPLTTRPADLGAPPTRRHFAAWLAASAGLGLVLPGCGEQRAVNLAGAGSVAGAVTGGGGPNAGLEATLAAASPDMGAVLRELAASGAQPVEALTVAEARRQPTIGAAARRVAAQRGLAAEPRPMAAVRELSFPASDGTPLRARLYVPHIATARGAPPLVIYWHGGGFVIGDLDAYDGSARGLAAESGAIVLSVDYRLAPEHRFPTAHTDAVAAWVWGVANAGRLGADPTRVALAGESAGGNLALHVALSARDAGGLQPIHLALIYPWVSTNTQTQSFGDNSAAVPLSRAGILWFLERIAWNPGIWTDPKLDVLGRQDLRGLPPTTIVSAAIDPLLSQGESLAVEILRAGQRSVAQRTWPGVTHEFFGLDPAVGAAREAQAFVGNRLRQSTAATPRVAAVR